LYEHLKGNTGFEGWLQSSHFFLFMTQKQTILFFFSIIILIISEYFLLRELYNDQRLPVLMVCLTGTVIGIFPVIKLFKKFRSGAK